MALIEVKLFGSPKVYKKKEKINFPFGKAEALFYYLVVEKESSRDVLISLFWGNIPEKSARKNLRNAIYVIKKVFNEEVLISPRRSIVKLNPEIDFKIDLEEFLNKKNKEAIEIYNGHFLEGFFVKNAEEFETWMTSLRHKHMDIYVNKLKKEINKYIENNQLNKAEAYCKKLINIDEFDEKGYRILMNLYRKQGKYNKCISIYNKLKELLNKELSVSPDVKTRRLFEEILIEKKTRKIFNSKDSDEFFYGRKKELKILNGNFFNFLQGNVSKSIVLFGEAGVGKSKLLSRFLNTINKDENIWILKTNCYQAEEKFLFKPWNDIFYQLSNIFKKENVEIPVYIRKIISQIFPTFIGADEIEGNLFEKSRLLKYEIVEEAVIDIFRKVSKRRKIVLVFEDLQWIDNMSLNLLKNIILKDKNKSITVLVTCRNESIERVENFLTEVGKYGLIEKLSVGRFNKEETLDFVDKMLPDKNLSLEIKNSIYKESEGNALFIVELLNNLKEKNNFTTFTPKLKDVLKSRLLDISTEERKILNIASVFFDKFNLDVLKEITQKNELELVEILEELQRKKLIREILDSSGNINFMFTHQKLREFIYSQMSMAKRRILHNRVSHYLAGKLTGSNSDKLLYPKLIYHNKKAGNKLEYFKYKIKNLEQYIHLIHEIFPVIDENDVLKKNFLYMSDEEIEKQLNDINELLKEIKEEVKLDSSLVYSEITFLHMLGRYNIGKGDHKEGLKIIRKMIDRALKTKNYSFALKGYLKIIYYCINTHNIKLMNSSITKALDIAKKSNSKGEIAILLRLKGFQKIMNGEFNKGEELLKKSIKIFDNLDHKEKYELNIAASFTYIGESKRRKKEFNKAIYYYEKAISMCEKKGLVGGLTIAYTKAGQAAYEVNNYEKAKEYFKKAISLYNQFNLVWGRSIANGYFSLILVKEKEWDEALKYINKAEKFAKKVNNPYEIGLLYRVKAEMCKLVKENNKKILGYHCQDNIDEYCNKGLKYLKDIKGCYEKEVLKRLKNIS
ncbi:AAA family ATPase [Thermohalobacter berrensis]|uniref:Bacterial transcriptional activator domain-containing protein n=1 Tax=Thermohalobacter berrensis TaxID=99594 RepID=A0A419T689_9FIRM|nr:AAA family ATPase [Thermohalobacter berrensis]RKD32936.1 hypothetical protein BET03_09980 [Thermohalobacter berrensis]